MLGTYHDGPDRRTYRASDHAAGLIARPDADSGAVHAELDVLDYLRGSWRVRRQLTDHAAGTGGWFEGEAQFSPLDRPAGADGAPEPQGHAARDEEAAREAEAARADEADEAAPCGVAALAYHEHGELRLGEHHGPASRSLLYRRSPAGGADVCFSDGREFYRLELRSGGWRGRHPCDRDLYVVTGRLLGAGLFQERWEARGPAKDYETVATFARISAPRP